MLEGLLVSAVLLFFIFDPFASLPIFISLTKEQDEAGMVSSANRAVLVAAILFIVFAFIGKELMELFGISPDGFRIAGGVVLMMMAVEVIFGLELTKQKNNEVAWVVIATPILTGAGVITTAILLVDRYDLPTVMIAGGFALIVTWTLLRNAHFIVRVFGRNAMDIMSRIIGLIIAALAVEYIMSGVLNYIHAYVPAIIYGALGVA